MFDGNRLKTLRLEKKLTQIELGKLFNISHATINRYEKGVHEPDTESIDKLAKFFSVSADYLLGRSNFRDELPKGAWTVDKFTRLPIIGIIRAGEPIFAEQNIIGYEFLPTENLPEGTCFLLKVIGDSMNLSHIVEDQKVLVRSQEEVENGQVAVVLVDGENATVKKFYKTDTTVTLMPHSSNPEHQPRVIDTKKVSVKVIGRVIQSVINF